MPAGGSGTKMKVPGGGGPEWDEVCPVLHLRLLDAAAELNVSVTYLRRLCRQKGLAAWPGKKVRYMNKTAGNVVVPEGDAAEAGGSSWTAALPGNYRLAKFLEDKEAYYRRRPAKKLTTLNLIDKIGSSSGSKNN